MAATWRRPPGAVPSHCLRLGQPSRLLLQPHGRRSLRLRRRWRTPVRLENSLRGSGHQKRLQCPGEEMLETLETATRTSGPGLLPLRRRRRRLSTPRKAGLQRGLAMFSGVLAFAALRKGQGWAPPLSLRGCYSDHRGPLSSWMKSFLRLELVDMCLRVSVFVSWQRHDGWVHALCVWKTRARRCNAGTRLSSVVSILCSCRVRRRGITGRRRRCFGSVF